MILQRRRSSNGLPRAKYATDQLFVPVHDASRGIDVLMSADQFQKSLERTLAARVDEIDQQIENLNDERNRLAKGGKS